jgi:uncharacterized membrane protein
MTAIALSAFCIFFPALALVLKERVGIFKKWSPLIVCYAVGLVVGNLGILPQGSAGILDGISTASVALSIPLLLFSVDMSRWKALAGRTGLAFALACVAVLIVSAVAHLAFARSIPDSWQVAGLLVGVYTGGTPNMAAIKTALGADMNTYLAVNTSDIVLSAIYILFVMTVAQRFFALFMPRFKAPAKAGAVVDETESQIEDLPFTRLFSKGVRLPLLGTVGLDLVIVAAGLGLSFLVPGEWQTLVVILSITTLGLGASLLPRVRSTKGTFAAGEYVLYVFCLAVGAMGDISKLLQAAPQYFIYVAVVLFGSFILHAALCALFKIDVDTFLVVSTATINSAPFVGLTCVALNNKSLLVPGITAGIMGYALGNYLGIGLAMLVRHFG